MPSRRHLLTGVGTLIVGTGAAKAAESPSEPTSSPLDWPMSRYDPAGTGHDPDASGPTSDVEPAWIHEAPGWFRGASTPVRLGDTVYAAGGGLLACSVDDGTQEFAHEGPYTSSLAAADASPYRTPTLAVTSTGGLYGLNAGGGIGIPGSDRRIGAQRWSGPPPTEYRATIEHAPTTDPVADDGMIYAPVVGTNDLVAVNATDGSVHWRVTVVDDEVISASFGRPTVDDAAVYVANWPHRVSAYDREDGTQLWQRERDEQMQLSATVTDAGILVTTRSGVALLDADDGEPIWERDLDGNATAGTAAATADRVLVSDGDEEFHALDLETGAVDWSVPFERETNPIVADGVVYAVERNASLVALDVDTGRERFRFEPAEVPLSPPIVGDGRLFVVNRSRILALEESA